jgi:hypothetical protein
LKKDNVYLQLYLAAELEGTIEGWEKTGCPELQIQLISFSDIGLDAMKNLLRYPIYVSKEQLKQLFIVMRFPSKNP